MRRREGRSYTEVSATSLEHKPRSEVGAIPNTYRWSPALVCHYDTLCKFRASVASERSLTGCRIGSAGYDPLQESCH